MQFSRTGKWIYAIGGNPSAARASGINVNKILIIVYSLCGIVYSLCGFLSGIGALILAGRTDSGYPNAGLQSELDAIAACIIGGASFFGGRGTVLGVFAGVMIMGILRNGLNLFDGCKLFLATGINWLDHCISSLRGCFKKRFRHKKINTSKLNRCYHKRPCKQLNFF